MSIFETILRTLDGQDLWSSDVIVWWKDKMWWFMRVNFIHSTRVFSPNGIHIKKRDFLHFFTPLLFPTKLISSLDLRESIHMCNYCLLTNQLVDSLAFVLRTDLPKLSFSHAVNEFLIKRVIVEIHWLVFHSFLCEPPNPSGRHCTFFYSSSFVRSSVITWRSAHAD